MKKNLFKITTVIMLIIALAGCGNKNNAADSNASKEAEKKEEAPVTEVAEEKSEEENTDMESKDPNDIGEGSFYLKNESGTTENGEPITVSYDESVGFIHMGIVTSGIDISRKTAVYVDDTLMTLNYFEAPETEILIPQQLEDGPHNLILKQFKDDDREGEPTLVKSAPFIYETK